MGMKIIWSILMHNKKSERYCRICGLDQGEEGVRDNNGCASFDICSCCGVEFGHEDINVDTCKKYRNNWINTLNAKWFNEKIKPKHWSLDLQLKQIISKFK